MIAFSSDEELMEAVKGISDGIFRVYIVEKKTHKNETQPPPDQANLVHPVIAPPVRGLVAG